jgi:hypothetical protein
MVYNSSYNPKGVPYEKKESNALQAFSGDV